MEPSASPMKAPESCSGRCFIGYGWLEDLVTAHADPSRPFYAEFAVQRFPGDLLGWAAESVTVQDFDPDGHVRYCRISFGGYHLLGGRPFEEDVAERVAARAKEGFERIVGYLAANGFRVERAMVAMPKDLPVLAGSARLLFDEAAPGDAVPA